MKRYKPKESVTFSGEMEEYNEFVKDNFPELIFEPVEKSKLLETLLNLFDFTNITDNWANYDIHLLETNKKLEPVEDDQLLVLNKNEKSELFYKQYNQLAFSDNETIYVFYNSKDNSFTSNSNLLFTFLKVISGPTNNNENYYAYVEGLNDQLYFYCKKAKRKTVKLPTIEEQK